MHKGVLICLQDEFEQALPSHYDHDYYKLMLQVRNCAVNEA